MKKLVMKDGNPKFILDTNDKDYYKCIYLLEKHNMYQICDIKDANDFVFCYDCYAYFDIDGKYKTKDGRSFNLDYDLYISKRENEKFPNVRGRIIRQSYDGKDGIHFMLPIYNISLEYIINTAATALSSMYKEKLVGIVEPEYIYAIYSCRIDSKGNKKITIPYYTKDIKATQELINLENMIHKLYSNGKEKGGVWYEISEIDVQGTKNMAEYIKSIAKEITLEDVKNIKPSVTACITTNKSDDYDKEYPSYSPLFNNKPLYITLYPNQPKIEKMELNTDTICFNYTTRFLYISDIFIVNLEDDVVTNKQTIYSYLLNKARTKIANKAK